jgi:hypothetical protein
MVIDFSHLIPLVVYCPMCLSSESGVRSRNEGGQGVEPLPVHRLKNAHSYLYDESSYRSKRGEERRGEESDCSVVFHL